MISGHGDDRYRYEVEIKHNFSSNVYYQGCPPALLTMISDVIHNIENYPSPAAEELNEAAARKFQLNPNQFLFTNGATEAFYLIAQLFSGTSAAILAPTFSEYEDACRIHGVNFEIVTRAALKPGNHELVIICNPNNPNGSFFPTKELVELIGNTPDTTFVIDEAYIEFTVQVTSIMPFVNQFNNLIVVRSLTKTFAIPGLRLGYLVSSSTVVQQLLANKMPWSVNALAIKAGLEIFEHYDQWHFDVHQLLAETREFVSMLSTISWLKVKRSHTSYFLVELLERKASDLKDYLAIEHGILIRDATNFKLLDGENIRLATQSPEANASLIKALQSWK